MFENSRLLILQALQKFFAALVYSANTSFDALLESLLSSAKPSPQSGGVAKQALYSIAQCVAVLCLAAGDQKCSSTVKMLTEILKDDSISNSVRLLSSPKKTRTLYGCCVICCMLECKSRTNIISDILLLMHVFKNHQPAISLFDYLFC